ncbi:MAG: transcription elongation factor [Acidobacteria bacterium]|nr:MAG: transcription elongation factor [Acidobacteriota bacterium]
MPNKTTVRKAKQNLRAGKKPSTAAGEFVHQEIEHVRHGQHGARSPQQAIAIGLNEARRAGIPLKPPKRGKTSDKTRQSAERAYKEGQSQPGKKASLKRSRARERALQREPKNTASHKALSKQARSAALRRKKAA